MAYYLTAFGGVTFPLTMPVTEMPTATGMSGALRTLGGGYDAFGADAAPVTFPYQIQYKVVAASQVAATYMTAVNGIRALGRKKGTLTRTDQSGTTHTCSARCLNVAATDSVDTFAAIEVTLTFEIWSHWAKNPTSTLTNLDASPKNVTATNGGNVTVSDAILTFTAGATHPITALTVTCGAAKWSFGGASPASDILANTALVVDCGEWSVKNNGVDAYQYFTFDPAAHTLAGMLDLAPGANTIAVASTCGGARTITVAFSEAWA